MFSIASTSMRPDGLFASALERMCFSVSSHDAAKRNGGLRQLRSIDGVRLLGMAALLALLVPFASFDTKAATTSNFSDQWWNPNQSGWGASVLQQGDVIFVDLFVYGPDNRPIWYTAAAYYQPQVGSGHLVFTGDLYQTMGPFFGNFFNPAAVTSRRVGSLTFDADSTDTAVLVYTVDGLVVSKSVTRQLWTFENFTGAYYGGLVYDLYGCTNPSSNGHVEELGSIRLTQSAQNSLTMVSESSAATCTYTGTYSQAGHMGTVNGSFSCTNGIHGSFTAFEMEKTISGMTGRIVGQDNFCNIDGRFGGVLR